MSSTLESLVGQLLVTGLMGHEVDAGFAAHYDQCPSGGFILFGRNIRDARQVGDLTGALIDLASQGDPAWGPPLIAIDQEGGTLSPLKGIVTSLPGNMGLAATGDPRTARSAGYITGRDLASLGINVNFAPVLDLAREPLNPAVGTRSFGDDPRRVAEFGVAYASGLLEAGVLFAAKHFPGHGGIPVDSHLALPECMTNKADLLARDAIPFIKVARLPHAALMAAHIRFTALDPLLPASLSPSLVTNLLREEIGFDGVVITDCLEMAGVREVAAVPEAAVMALEAGCDLALVSHTPELQEAAFAAVLEAVRTGRLPMERVERSVARLSEWKRGLAAASTPRVAVRDLTLEDLGERVVTSVHTRPFGTDSLILVTPAMEQITLAEDSLDVVPLLEKLENHGIRCASVPCPMNPDTWEIGGVISRIEEAWREMGEADGRRLDGPDAMAHQTDAFGPRVALVVRNGGDARGQAALAAAIESRWPLLLIGIRDPREMRPVEEALACQAPALFTYSTEDVVLSALARVLAGEASPRGVMPVRI